LKERRRPPTVSKAGPRRPAQQTLADVEVDGLRDFEHDDRMDFGLHVTSRTMGGGGSARNEY
jgi:hypothetical protein